MVENERLLTDAKVRELWVRHVALPETAQPSERALALFEALLAAQDAATIRALDRAGLLAHERAFHIEGSGVPCPACKLLAEGARDG